MMELNWTEFLLNAAIFFMFGMAGYYIGHRTGWDSCKKELDKKPVRKEAE